MTHFLQLGQLQQAKPSDIATPYEIMGTNYNQATTVPMTGSSVHKNLSPVTTMC